MMMWPAVTLLGFLVLTALVIAMGTQSTARYERERARAPVRRGTPRRRAGGRGRRIDRTDRPHAPPSARSGGAFGVSGAASEPGRRGVEHRPVQRLQQVEAVVHPRELPAPEVPGRLALALVEVRSAVPVASACSSHSHATTRWPAASR